MSDFLPDYRAVPTSKGWRPSVCRFVGEREKLVPYEGGPRYFATKDEAVEAAKEYMRQSLNPPIRAEKAEADTLGRAQWHIERAARAAEQQEQALGGIISRRRLIKIERRRA